MKRFFLVLSAVVLGCCIAPLEAHAHHTTITCIVPTGTWKIINSEADKSMTFTSPQGPSGSIAAGGSTTVQYVGTTLTIVGVWSNGQTNTSTGSGTCNQTPPTTTTTTTTTTTQAPTTTVAPTTTAPATTTVPPSTTSTVASPTTAPATSPSTTASPTTAESPSTVACEPDWSRAEDGSCVPPGYYDTVADIGEPAPPASADPVPSTVAELPETGSSTGQTALLALAVGAFGVALFLGARRRDGTS